MHSEKKSGKITIIFFVELKVTLYVKLSKFAALFSELFNFFFSFKFSISLKQLEFAFINY